jgi:hypothetical protein
MMPDKTQPDDAFFCRTYTAVHEKNFGSQISCEFCVESAIYSLQELVGHMENDLDPEEYAKWQQKLLANAKKVESHVPEPQNTE